MLGREAVEIRSTPVNIELNMTGVNRDLGKLALNFLVTAGIACRPLEPVKEYGLGGQSSSMKFQASQEVLYFPDARHAQLRRSEFKIVPRNEWAHDGRGIQRFIRIPAKLGDDQEYCSYYIPCRMTMTEPVVQPILRLAVRGGQRERGDVDKRQEWFRKVEIEEEEERVQIAMQAALDEEDRVVQLAVLAAQGG